MKTSIRIKKPKIPLTRTVLSFDLKIRYVNRDLAIMHEYKMYHKDDHAADKNPAAKVRDTLMLRACVS